MSDIFGRLTLDALKHDPIETGTGVGIAISGVIIVFLLFYYRGWKWLWKEWLTSLDHKKNRYDVYHISHSNAIQRTGRCFMMRAQQALSVGDSYGFLTSAHFQQIFPLMGVP